MLIVIQSYSARDVVAQAGDESRANNAEQIRQFKAHLSSLAAESVNTTQDAEARGSQ